MKFIRPERCLQICGKKYRLVLSHESDSTLSKREPAGRQLPCPPIHRFWADPTNRLRLQMFFKNEFQVDCSRLSYHDTIQLISNYLVFRRFFILPVKFFEPHLEIILPEPKPPKPIDVKPPHKHVLSWIEIELVDKEGNPVPGVDYQINRLTGGVVGQGTLDGSGFARVDEIDPNDCEVTFPKVDGNIWDIES